MYESPRDRRLKTDFKALQKLKAQSSIVDFETFQDPPQRYLITFHGKGLAENKKTDEVVIQNVHKVEIKLGLTYPRNKPELKWKTEIFHPNISALGQVCLGGYGTNWVPSLNLDELCEMLWDMIRFANYDTKSPYNYKSARWVERQAEYSFPLDDRPIKDRIGRERDGQDVAIDEAVPEAKPEEDIIFIGDDVIFEDDDDDDDKQEEEQGIIYIGDD